MDSADDLIAELAFFAVVAIVAIVAAGVFSRKLGVASPLILIVIGVGFSYIPGAPVSVPPEVILFGLLPFILYAASVNVPVGDFRRNLTSISALSVVLVVVSAAITGWFLYMVFPDLSLAAGIAIGAVISPTDAVAATSIGKKLGLPPRLVTIMEGESLVNDATALVLLRSAIAATAGTVAFWEVAVDFVYAVVVALIIGLLVGVVTVWARSRLHDSVLETTVSFAVPFMAFLPTEAAGASGVLAVVAAGLYSGHAGARSFSAQARVSEKLTWRTVQFVLENGVFLLMGIEISSVLSGVDNGGMSVLQSVLLGLAVTAILIVVRFAFVAPLLVLLRAQLTRAERGHARFGRVLEDLRERDDLTAKEQRRRARAERIFSRRETDLSVARAEGLGWRGGVILGWSGMRGVVTLAAAQSLPSDTPYRPQLVLIAFTVAVVTLLLQGGTLPWVIRLTGIRGRHDDNDRERLTRLFDELRAAGDAVIDDPTQVLGDAPVDDDVIERVRSHTILASEAAWRSMPKDAAGVNTHEQYRRLRLSVLAAQREALVDARSSGQYPSRVLARAQTMLDLDENRLTQLEGLGS